MSFDQLVNRASLQKKMNCVVKLRTPVYIGPALNAGVFVYEFWLTINRASLQQKKTTTL